MFSPKSVAGPTLTPPVSVISTTFGETVSLSTLLPILKVAGLLKDPERGSESFLKTSPAVSKKGPSISVSTLSLIFDAENVILNLS